MMTEVEAQARLAESRASIIEAFDSLTPKNSIVYDLRDRPWPDHGLHIMNNGNRVMIKRTRPGFIASVRTLDAPGLITSYDFGESSAEAHDRVLSERNWLPIDIILREGQKPVRTLFSI